MYYLIIYFLLGLTMGTAIDRAQYHLRTVQARAEQAMRANARR